MLVPGVDDYALVIITNEGNGVALDLRLLPHWDDEAVMRALHHRFGDVGPDEAVAGVIPRRLLREAQRFYAVSIYGQIKATESREYSRLSGDAITAVLIKKGDALHTVFGGESRTSVFVGSSAGKAIVFDTKDIRSQGRKATGVRAIGLDPDARVIGSFNTAGEEWVGLVTDQGLCKRMRLSDFRSQGRGGNGLQACRLASDDHVASMAALSLDGDTIIVTDRGRVTRFPVYDLPYGGRASKGEPILELEEGEIVVQMVGVPAGEIPEA
jgi:DNA gyrase subunit A